MMAKNAYVREPIHYFSHDWPRLIWQANYIEEVAVNPHDVVVGEGVTIIAPGDRGIEDRHRVIESFRRKECQTSLFLDRLCSPEQAPEAYNDLLSRRIFSVVFDWSLLR